MDFLERLSWIIITGFLYGFLAFICMTNATSLEIGIIFGVVFLIGGGFIGNSDYNDMKHYGH